jgi:hypothetical protein
LRLLKQPDLLLNHETVGSFRRERNPAKGGSLPTFRSGEHNLSCHARIVGRYSLTGLDRGRYFALPVGIFASQFVALDQQEQPNRATFRKKMEIAQGR